MQIDIRTVILIIGIFDLIQILVFVYQYFSSRNLPGPGWWLLWCLAGTAGSAIILLRSIPALYPVVVLLQNPLIVAGSLFLYTGIKKFLGSSVIKRQLVVSYSVYYLLHLFFFIIINNAEIRTLLLYAGLSTYSILAVYALLRNKTPENALTNNGNAILFSIQGTIFLARAIMIISGIKSPTMFAPDMINYLSYFSALIINPLLTFGLIIMVNQKLNTEITEAKTHFEQIFDASPDALIISRLSDGKFTGCNVGFTRMTGFSEQEVTSEDVSGLSFWNDQGDAFKISDAMRSDEGVDNAEIVFRKKDKSVFTGLISARIIRFKGIPHIICAIKDITGIKKAEEEIKLVNEKLRKTNAEKDKFFSIIAHDLIGPFGTFLGLTGIMKENIKDGKVDELDEIASILKDEAHKLFMLLENLLEWSRLERGIMPLKPESAKLLELIHESIGTSAESAVSKKQEVIINVSEDLVVYADKKSVQTVIRNLMSNAVKFTPRLGKICISAGSVSENMVEIEVKDTGIGMDRTLLNNLFRLDVPVNRSGTEGEPSTGLGLIICKELLEREGGKLKVDSEEGKGTLFSFSLPTYSKSRHESSLLV